MEMCRLILDARRFDLERYTAAINQTCEGLALKVMTELAAELNRQDINIFAMSYDEFKRATVNKVFESPISG